MSARRWLSPGLLLAALTIAVSAAVSRALAFSDSGLSLFWPVAGIGLVMMHRWGLRGAVALWAGLLGWAAVAYPQDVWAAPLVAVAGSIGPALAWWVTRRVGSRHPNPFHHLGAVQRVMSAQLLVGGPVAALLGTALFVGLDPGTSVAGIPTIGTLLSYVAVYWVIECCGALLVTPLAWDVLITQKRASWAERLRETARAFHGHGGLTTAILVLAGGLATAFALTDAANARAFSYLILPMLVVATQRCDARASHVLLAMTGLLITATSAFAMQRLRTADTGATAELLLLVLFMLVSAGVVQMLVALNAERQDARRRLEAQAFTDPVSGLANEAGLYRHHEKQAHVGLAPGGLVMLQLANWQAIEQLDGPPTLMRHEWDAARLLGAESPGWFWARLGSGDLVAIAPAEDVQTQRLDTLAATLNGAWRHDSESQARVPTMWRACGVRWSQGPTAPALNVGLARLREASQWAVEAPQSPVLVIEPQDDNRLKASAQAVEDVRAALREGRITLWAQAIGKAPGDPREAGQGRKCEILVRLLDDHGEVQAPARFLAAAMQGGLMQQLDREVIDRTLAWFAQRPSVLDRIDYCSINLSAPSLGNPGLAAWIASRFRHHGVSARRFTFEITESQAIGQPRQAAQTITELRALGCRVAIDDFGTGHATFDYLKRFEVDIVKIDGSFIKDLHQQPLDRAIVRSMVDIARLLHVHTVAEHVDRPDILEWTQSLGIDDVQGYWLGRPQPLEDLLAGD